MIYTHEMRTMASLILFLAAAFLLCPDTAAANQRNAAELERGSVAQRLDALQQILDIPPEQRDSKTWSAIEQEAQRMLTFRRPSGPVVSDAQRELNSAYTAGLVRALGESRNPALIPLLIDYAGSGRYAIDALVRFGDLAVPAMLRIGRGTRDDLGQIGGVTMALGYMLRGPVPGAIAPVSDGSRRQIEDFAQELLATKLTFNNVIGVSIIALATGRSDLREELERLATDSDAWVRRGLIDPDLIKGSQDAIQAQLRKASTPKP